MADRDALEIRVEELAAQLQALSRKVELLEGRAGKPAESWPPVTAAEPSAVHAGADAERAGDVSEEILSWASKAALLPRVSTLCFLLVIALVLRTITDNNLINTLFGSALGMGYAAFLIVAGWNAYRRGSPLAPVIAACGAVLISTVVVETHARFQSLPLVPAYMTLMAAGAAMTFISYRFNVFLPISLGTLGMCLAGAAIDYPAPFYPYLSMVLWTANLLAFFAARLKRCSWLRWIVLAITAAMLSQWGIKLGMVLLGKETPPAYLAATWFLPVMAVFAVSYAGIALSGLLRDGGEAPARFDFFLPALGGALAYTLTFYVVNALGKSVALLGWAGLAWAVAHVGVAFRLAGRGPKGGVATNAFLLGGSVLMALALPGATGSFLLSLPALAVLAFFLIILARQWEYGGTRAISYLVEVYAAGALAIYLQGSSTAAVDLVTVIPAGLVAVINLFHYQLARRSPPLTTSVFFSRFDRSDRSAVVLLLAALTSSFFMLRAAVYPLLLTMPGEIANSFRCTQTIIINLAAAGLMLAAVRRRSREIRNVAILVTLIGAFKVFLHDMLGTHGVPLVLSVFTFGLVAALESIALGRWSRTVPDSKKGAQGEPDGAVPAGQRH
ncbi:MAG TPA: hypothetical protein VL949_09490 [Geobacteraceae bacterium]|nr:hypothetical protein [Geobacteraceae bacterium]